MTKFKLALAVVVIGATFAGGYMLAQKTSTITVTNNSDIEAAVDETARRYETQIAERDGDLKDIVKQLEDEVLARLQRDESGDVDTSGGMVFYSNDPRSDLQGTCARIGGKRNIECDSWGVMQFKLTTVMHYYKELYGEDLTEKEALLIALDDDKARSLARDIIFKVEGGVWNWSAANKDASYYSYQIPFIRTLIEKIK